MFVDRKRTIVSRGTFDSPWWHVYLGVEVAALLHKCADRKPKTVGQAEFVDSSQQRNVVAVRIQGAHVTALMTMR